MVRKSANSRRDFLQKLWLWIVVWISSSAALEALAQDPLEQKIDASVEKTLVNYHPSYISRMEKKIEGKIDDYTYIMKKYASSDVDTYSDKSKFDYVTDLLSKSKLPEYLRDTIPFVPFQESGYRLSVVSAPPASAKWPWQFIASTGRVYGLVEWSWENTRDYRTDMKKSTKAAVKYFGILYEKLKSDPHYKSLEQKYSLQEDDLLLPATINAYNSWPEHMKHAFKIMDTEQELSADIAKAAQYKRWLFVYLTTEYIKKWKTYQKPYFPSPYYFEESADYVYNIEAFKYIKNEGSFATIKSWSTSPVQPLKNTTKTQEAAIGTSYHSVVWAVSAWLTYLFAKKIQKWTSKLSRREFFSAWVAAVWWSVWSGIYGWYANLDGDSLREKMWYILWKNELTKLWYDDVLSPEKNEIFMEIYYRSIALARTGWNDRAADTLSKRSLKDTMDLRYYPWFQYLWDAAFEIYKEKSDNTYLQMAQYFYNRAWQLVEEQKLWKYKKPKDGIAQLEKREQYCKKALDMIDVEFAK